MINIDGGVAFRCCLIAGLMTGGVPWAPDFDDDVGIIFSLICRVCEEDVPRCTEFRLSFICSEVREG